MHPTPKAIVWSGIFLMGSVAASMLLMNHDNTAVRLKEDNVRLDSKGISKDSDGNGFQENQSANGVSSTAVPSVQVKSQSGNLIASLIPGGVPERIRAITGSTGDGKYSSRMSALKDLGTNLSKDERQALLNMLLDRGILPIGEQQTFALKNEIMNALRESAKDSKITQSEVEDTLLKVFRDAKQNLVMRDYAIQHLACCYTKSEDKGSIQKAFEDGLKMDQSSIAGTSLLSLYHLSPENPELQKTKIATSALALAKDPQASEGVRGTAIQVCGELGVVNAKDTIHQIATDSTVLSLRISAISAIGKLGDQSSITLLEQFANNQGDLVSTVAKNSIQQIQTRMGL